MFGALQIHPRRVSKAYRVILLFVARWRVCWSRKYSCHENDAATVVADSALSRFQLFIRNKVLLKKKKITAIYRTVIASKTIRLTIVFVVFIRLNYGRFRSGSCVGLIRCAKRDFFFFCFPTRIFIILSSSSSNRQRNYTFDVGLQQSLSAYMYI